MLRIQSSLTSKRVAAYTAKVINNETIGINYWKKVLALFGISTQTSSANINLVLKTLFNLSSLINLQRDKVNLRTLNYKDSVEFLIKYKYYKGTRLLAGLPLHGQRTHTNARTSRRLLKKN